MDPNVLKYSFLKEACKGGCEVSYISLNKLL